MRGTYTEICFSCCQCRIIDTRTLIINTGATDPLSAYTPYVGAGREGGKGVACKIHDIAFGARRLLSFKETKLHLLSDAAEIYGLNRSSDEDALYTTPVLR